MQGTMQSQVKNCQHTQKTSKALLFSRDEHEICNYKNFLTNYLCTVEKIKCKLYFGVRTRVKITLQQRKTQEYAITWTQNNYEQSTNRKN